MTLTAAAQLKLAGKECQGTPMEGRIVHAPGSGITLGRG